MQRATAPTRSSKLQRVLPRMLKLARESPENHRFTRRGNSVLWIGMVLLQLGGVEVRKRRERSGRPDAASCCLPDARCRRIALYPARSRDS